MFCEFDCELRLCGCSSKKMGLCSNLIPGVSTGSGVGFKYSSQLDLKDWPNNIDLYNYRPNMLSRVKPRSATPAGPQTCHVRVARCCAMQAASHSVLHKLQEPWAPPRCYEWHKGRGEGPRGAPWTFWWPVVWSFWRYGIMATGLL